VSARPVRRAAALLLFLGGLLLLGASPASAHVQIISSTPGDGSRLSAAPAQVSVRLSENIGIQPNSLHVVDRQGAPADTGPVFQPGENAQEFAIRLRPGLPDGSYLIEYAFVSADSHPVRGTFAFVVGNGPLITSAGAVSAATGTDGVVNALFTTFRWVSFLAVALLGGLVFVQTCRPAGRTDPRARALLRIGCGLAAATAVAGFFLQGPYVAGKGLSALFDPSMIEATWRVAYGKLLVLRLVAAGTLAVLLPRLLVPADALSQRLRFRYENIALVSGLVVLLSFSATGHAITDPILLLSISADMAHFGAIAIWAGGLAQLALCLRRPAPDEEVGPVVERFSRIAAIAVCVIVVSGTYLAFRYVPSVSALWTTTYGRLLLLKLAGFALLLALANVSRQAMFRGITGRGRGVLTAELTRLRLAVGAEVALLAVVLGLAAMLSSISPAG